ncbi:hypothetical protein Tco_0524063 [Tanacetum coccineum]
MGGLAMQEDLLHSNFNKFGLLVDSILGKKDPEHPDKVYKVDRQYGCIKHPREWSNIDDIIFGSTNKELCTGFKKLMKDKFHMSSMGELTFFLGLQSASTPVDLEKPLVKDGDADDVDVHLYRSMIGDYARGTQDRKSTIGGCQFFGNRLISWQCKKQTVVATSITEAEYVPAAMFMEVLITSIIKTRLGISKEVGTPRYLSLVVPLTKVGDEAVHKELGDRMERVATTASS